MKAWALAVLLCATISIFPPFGGGPPRICTTCCGPDGTCQTVGI